MDSIRNECATKEAGPHGLEEKPLLSPSPTVGSHQILEADETNDPTILDYLNEDCWRVVLDFLPFKDIVRSETVSQRWQEVVLTYLRGFRICADYNNTFLNTDKTQRYLSLSSKWGYADYSSLNSWTNKLGSSVAATGLNSEEELKIFGENCPNLENVLFCRVPEKLLLNNLSENFKWLQHICFKLCPASDRCVSGFIKSNVLKELIIKYNDQLTGQCLVDIKSTNLKTLVLKRCQALEPRHLQAAADRFSQLTKLELVNVPNEVCNQLHMVLEKMPNLEHLRIDQIDWGCEIFDDVFESVCRLQRLKYLSVYQSATDKNVGDVARCCTELRSLELKYCDNLTVDGLTALCRYAGERLTTLAIICCTRVTENDLAYCILSCPNLTTLNVIHTFPHSQAMAAAAAAARRDMRARTPLRLHVNNVEVLDDWNDFDFDINPWIHVNFCESESDEEDYLSEEENFDNWDDYPASDDAEGG